MTTERRMVSIIIDQLKKDWDPDAAVAATWLIMKMGFDIGEFSVTELAPKIVRRWITSLPKIGNTDCTAKIPAIKVLRDHLRRDENGFDWSLQPSLRDLKKMAEGEVPIECDPNTWLRIINDIHGLGTGFEWSLHRE